MNIFNYFRKKGIDTVDASFYRKIDEWTSWYNSNVKKFTYYKVYSDAVHVRDAAEKVWGWQKNFRRTSQIFF